MVVNGHTQMATEIEPNRDDNDHFVLLTRLTFVSAVREAKCTQMKIEHYQPVWKKIIDTPPTPPPPVNLSSL